MAPPCPAHTRPAPSPSHQLHPLATATVTLPCGICPSPAPSPVSGDLRVLRTSCAPGAFPDVFQPMVLSCPALFSLLSALFLLPSPMQPSIKDQCCHPCCSHAHPARDSGDKAPASHGTTTRGTGGAQDRGRVSGTAGAERGASSNPGFACPLQPSAPPPPTSAFSAFSAISLNEAVKRSHPAPPAPTQEKRGRLRGPHRGDRLAAVTAVPERLPAPPGAPPDLFLFPSRLPDHKNPISRGQRGSNAPPVGSPLPHVLLILLVVFHLQPDQILAGATECARGCPNDEPLISFFSDKAGGGEAAPGSAATRLHLF